MGARERDLVMPLCLVRPLWRWVRESWCLGRDSPPLLALDGGDEESCLKALSSPRGEAPPRGAGLGGEAAGELGWDREVRGEVCWPRTPTVGGVMAATRRCCTSSRAWAGLAGAVRGGTGEVGTGAPCCGCGGGG